jgi:hypothetical protein
MSTTYDHGPLGMLEDVEDVDAAGNVTFRLRIRNGK